MAILQPKVQEIAKDLKLTSKEIIEKLSKMGHIVKGPSSQLSEEQLGIIFDIFTNMYDIGDEELVKPPRAKAEPKKAEKKPAAKKEKPKWVMAYVVHYGKKAKSFKTKTEADTEAMKLLKNGEEDVYVSKEYVNTIKDSEIVSEFKVEKTQKNTKPKTLKSNQSCKEIHKYMFYGFAAE